MEFLSTIGRGAASFLANPIVSTVGAGLSLVNAVRSFTGGSESAASGQTGAIAQGDPRFSSLPSNIASGQESAQSGENAFGGGFFPQTYSIPPNVSQFGQAAQQANILGPLAPALTGIARQVTRNLPQLAVGTGAGIVASQISDMQSNPTPFKRITRKLRSQIRQLYNMSMMDLEATANLASSIFGVRMTSEDIAFILMKRFRNDGALVTKAAMRKTRKTLNSLKRADDLLKMARPPTARRRAGVTQRVTKVSA
jgi:hypothetical protein